MTDWDDNPDVVAIRLQSMAEVCGKRKRPKKSPGLTVNGLVDMIRNGERVFIDAPDGTRWRLKGKQVKQ